MIVYKYDQKTFRITETKTTRASDGAPLQLLNYHYDAVGNITSITDGANWNAVLNSAAGGGHGHYKYDALYRLVEATGREHPSHNDTDKDVNFPPKPHTNDLTALTTYVEETEYDEVGNIILMRHRPNAGGTPAWERRYDYATDSNRLMATSVPNDPPTQHSAVYEYQDDLAATVPNNGGAHGSMTKMPHLAQMHWDFADRLQYTVKSNGSDQFAWFTYDASGQRVRKVYEHNGVVEERLYLGGIEICRRRNGSATEPLSATIQVERETLHVQDDAKRVAMAETLTADVPGGESTNVGDTRWRYQLDNHLGSSALEVDKDANVINYEEYHPYGSTAFRVSNSSEVSAKRYRYTGKEKDEETGLYYHGARYYAPWLGRWTAADPAGFVDGLNLYRYSRDNPVRFNDPGGTETKSPYGLIGLPGSNQLSGLDALEASYAELDEMGEELGPEPNQSTTVPEGSLSEEQDAQATLLESPESQQGTEIDSKTAPTQKEKMMEPHREQASLPEPSLPAVDPDSPLGVQHTEAEVEEILHSYAHDMAEADGTVDRVTMMWERHSGGEVYDPHFSDDQAHRNDTWEVPGVGELHSDEFGNYLAGYGAGLAEDQGAETGGYYAATRAAGAFYGIVEADRKRSGMGTPSSGNSESEWKYFGDSAVSVELINRGFHDANDGVPRKPPEPMQRRFREGSAW